MISADLHLHTFYSHGRNSPWEMYRAAQEKGLSLIGFTEHSPRPLTYNYKNEYRDHLTAHFSDYIQAISDMRAHAPDTCQVLLGLEMDWLPAEEAFVREACSAHDYDYLLGSVHFLDHWGFDDGQEPWQEADAARIYGWYENYFKTWRSMITSGLFQIASHPDLIKIYSVRHFHDWLAMPESRELVKDCLTALRDANMAMEISSAGLRKPCREIYPAPEIMELAQELKLNISFASDAHNTADIASSFSELRDYAKKYGFERQMTFKKGKPVYLPF